MHRCLDLTWYINFTAAKKRKKKKGNGSFINVKGRESLLHGEGVKKLIWSCNDWQPGSSNQISSYRTAFFSAGARKPTTSWRRVGRIHLEESSPVV